MILVSCFSPTDHFRTTVHFVDHHFLLDLSLYLAYIEHQSYDSELTLKILLDEKEHILPYIILERLSSVIVSLSTTVFKSPAIRFI